MAKNEDVVIVPMTKKQKILNVLKVTGIVFGGVIGIIAAVILYIWISGGFNPPYVPLTEMHFSQDEYVISDLDNIRLVPNEGCTELDVEIIIEDIRIVALVEDDNTKAVVNNPEEIEGQTEDTEQVVTDKYTTKIGEDIQIVPVKQVLNQGTEYEKLINVGGWVRLTAQRKTVTTHCWVFVDTPVESLDLVCNTDLEEVTPEPDAENPLQTFVVYPDSTISLGVNNQQPTKSFNLPSTTLSTETGSHLKSETNFLNKKDIYYVVSDDQIASVDNSTGIVTIKPNVEGSFTVYAYVVADYNNIGKEPNLEDYINNYGELEGFRNWEEDFDKIRVKTQQIKFNIKEIAVENISVAKDKLTFNLLSKNNQVQVNYVETDNNIIDANHSNIYHYAVDISLNYDSASKDILFENLVLMAGYIDNNTQDENALFINNNYVVLDDTYFKISNPTINHDASPRQIAWNIVVNEYKASGNVLVFAYPIYDAEGNVTNYHYDYAEVDINKVEIKNLTFNNIEKEISLAWNDAEGKAETKDLANTVSVTPSNATYSGNEYIKYFAEDNGILEVDRNLKIKTIDSKEYFAICKLDGENTNYNFINPLQVGKTNVMAVVLIYDANGELIQDENGYYKFDYIGHLSESIAVNIFKNLRVESVDIVDENDSSISQNKTVTVSKGDTLTVKIVCDELVANEGVFVWAIEGDENQDMLSQISSTANEKTLKYTLSANKAGSFVLYIADAEGNKLTYVDTFNIEILDTDLKELTLSSSAQYGVGVKLTSNSYEWKVFDENGNLTTTDLTFGVTFNPTNTNNKSFGIYAYDLGDYTIEDLANLKPQELQQTDVLTFEVENDPSKIVPIINKPGKVVVFAISTSGDIVSNPVIIEITLPEIVVEFSYGNTQEIISVDGLSKSLVSYDKIDEQNGRQGDKFYIGIYEKTTDTSLVENKTYYLYEQDSYVKVDTPSVLYIAEYYEFIDISELVSYKFAGDYQKDENGILTSASGVKIDNLAKTLTLCNIDNNVQETIVFCTEFGFESSAAQSFIYTLIADYNVVTSSNEYFAPSVVDIFGNYKEVVNPQESDLTTYYEIINGEYVLTADATIIDTKTYYQYVEPAVKFTNKAGNLLYLPETYNINNLSAEYLQNFMLQVEAPVDVDIASYYEFINNEYILTTDTLVDTTKTYYILNVSYSLHLSVLGTYCSIDYATGKVRLYKIPEDETTAIVVISIIKPDGTTGYAQQLLFTIKPAVTSNFTNSGIDENENEVFVIETTIEGTEGNYNFTDNSNIVDLSDKLNYINLNNSDIEIKDIVFSAGYSSLQGVEVLDDNKIVKYAKTTDTAVVEGKTYCVLTKNGLQTVEVPKVENIDTYYEVLSTYATYNSQDKTIVLSNDILNDGGQSTFQIKLQIKTSVKKDDISTNLINYYFVQYELPSGN